VENNGTPRQATDCSIIRHRKRCYFRDR